MKSFAQLISELDQTNKTNDKVQILKEYFSKAEKDELYWAIFFLFGKTLKKNINSTQLKIWAAEFANIEYWLFEESYYTVGDLAETIALVLPKATQSNNENLNYWVKYIESLSNLSEYHRKEKLYEAWNKLNEDERYVFNKLLTGSFRIGVSHLLVVRALAKSLNIETPILAHRLMGNWDPETLSIEELTDPNYIEQDTSRPYPFYLSSQLQSDVNDLGKTTEWQVEWKWDGIRSQVIFRDNELFIWSRGEDLVTDKFPEFQIFKNLPNGTVLDGEILAYKNNQILSFANLQTRITRKSVSKKNTEDVPVVFMAYDILEFEGKDLRGKKLEDRRKILEETFNKFEVKEHVDNKFSEVKLDLFEEVKNEEITNKTFQISPIVKFKTWEELTELRKKSRENKAEGFMLKKLDSTYKVGRKKGDWWKWKIDPYSIDAVMVYAQKGHGRRATLYTDYTFAIWDEGKLVPIAKAYSGLTDKEINKVNKFILKNTIDRFGPVRTVKPELVFELGFEGIQESTRHKSGIALRFPRILRWRSDKKVEEADTLERVKELLNQSN